MFTREFHGLSDCEHLCTRGVDFFRSKDFMAKKAKQRKKAEKPSGSGSWRRWGFAVVPCVVAGAGIAVMARRKSVDMFGGGRKVLECWDKDETECGAQCGVLASSSIEMLRELQTLVGDGFDFVDASYASAWLAEDDREGAWLLRRAPRATWLSDSVDGSLLVLDIECQKKWSSRSPRLEALRQVVAEIESGQDAHLPYARERVGEWSRRLEGADVDVRGLWTNEETMIPDALAIAEGDTALMRLARKCDARGVRALLELGARADIYATRRGMRALDLALSCDSRGLFGSAKEIADACGSACVNFSPSTTPEDGLGPVHRVLTRWASSFFPTRPKPNPWNALLGLLLAAGGDPLALTKTAAAETPLHVAVAKRNVEAVKILLESSPHLVEATDGLGFTPLAVAYSWRNWAVTLPRLLSANKDLRMQAFDGNENDCDTFPAYDDVLGGYPLLGTADSLASCGFLGAIPSLLLEAGARLDARDGANLTPLHHAHPALVDDPAVARSAEKYGIDLASLLDESRAHREQWHERPRASSSLAEALDSSEQTSCDAPVKIVEKNGIDDSEPGSLPVLFLNALDDSSWDAARKNWDVDALTRSHGSALVRAGPIPYSSAFSMSENVVSLRQAIETGRIESAAAVSDRQNSQEGKVRKPPSYVFEQIRINNPKDHPLGDVVVGNVGNLQFSSAATRNATFHNAQFYVGDPLSGAPLHYHSHAVNALIRGTKRWLLLPPSDAVYSRLPAADWLDPSRFEALSAAAAGERGGPRVYTCFQPPGSALYVPAGWAHAVMNLDNETVGAAFEFHLPHELTWSFEERATDTIASTRRL